VSQVLLQRATVWVAALPAAAMCARPLCPPALQPSLSRLACGFAYFVISLLWLVCPRQSHSMGPAFGGRLQSQLGKRQGVPTPRRGQTRPCYDLCVVAWLAWLPHACATAGLAQLGLDLQGTGVALSTWTGANPCTGPTTSNWTGVTCAGSSPVKLALSGLGLTGSVSCAASLYTNLTSVDLVRASARSLCSTAPGTDTPHV
jgi:hypothetical protein